MDFFVPVALVIDVLVGSVLMRRGQLRPTNQQGTVYLATQVVVVGCAAGYFLTEGTTKWIMLQALLTAVTFIGSVIGVSNNWILGGLAMGTTGIAIGLIALRSFASVPLLVIAGLFAAAACAIEGPKLRRVTTTKR